MGRLLARIGDLTVGVCICHDPTIPMVGFIVSGSPDVNVENRPQSRIGDIVVGACGHVGILVTGAARTRVNNRPPCRVGDQTTGCLITNVVTGGSQSQEGT